MKHGPKLNGARGLALSLRLRAEVSTEIFLQEVNNKKRSANISHFMESDKRFNQKHLFGRRHVFICSLHKQTVHLYFIRPRCAQRPCVYAFTVEAALSLSSQAGEQPKRKSKREAHGNSLSRIINGVLNFPLSVAVYERSVKWVRHSSPSLLKLNNKNNKQFAELLSNEAVSNNRQFQKPSSFVNSAIKSTSDQLVWWVTANKVQN